MKSVVEIGTARAAAPKLRRPAAGKTGTTDEDRDAWFVGFTPNLLAGVWVGFDERRMLGRGEEGARTALPIWIEFMTKALAGTPVSDFAQPPGVVVARIDPATGLLPAPGTEGIEEVFLDGTAPTENAAAPGEEATPDQLLLEGQGAR
jgi:penicillin-binding protein 1A